MLLNCGSGSLSNLFQRTTLGTDEDGLLVLALNNDIWLYGGDRNAIVRTVSESRRGVMPAWGRILDEVTVKQLAVYIHSLGGGK